jgi:hypothetical protein
MRCLIATKVPSTVKDRTVMLKMYIRCWFHRASPEAGSGHSLRCIEGAMKLGGGCLCAGASSRAPRSGGSHYSAVPVSGGARGAAENTTTYAIFGLQ